MSDQCTTHDALAQPESGRDRAQVWTEKIARGDPDERKQEHEPDEHGDEQGRPVVFVRAFPD